MNIHTHHQKVAKVQQEFATLKKLKEVSLKPKSTTHFFRQRTKKHTLDLTHLNQVIHIDPQQRIAHVEGCTKFFDIAKATLQHNLLPEVTPELRNITIGGTIAGLGVEASSFRYGMVHDTVIEYEVLTGNGDIVTCSPIQNSELFYALPNSLGTIGYVLSCKIRLMPAKNFVKVNIHTFETPQTYFAALEKICDEQEHDFVEGYLDRPDRFLIVTGDFTDLKDRQEPTWHWQHEAFWHFLSTHRQKNFTIPVSDYLWRWDHDCFWIFKGSAGLGSFINNSFVRQIFGHWILRSDFWIYLNGKTRRIRESQWYRKYMGIATREDILQDFVLNLDQARDFFEWYNPAMNVFPVWICPVRNDFSAHFPMHTIPGKYILDIGIYSGKKRTSTNPKDYYNHMLDTHIFKLGGFKGLYSTTLVTEKEFWQEYDHAGYLAVKNTYDREAVFPDVFEKAVGKKTS